MCFLVGKLTISSSHLQVWILLFNIIYHVDLIDRVALWRILEMQKVRMYMVKIKMHIIMTIFKYFLHVDLTDIANYSE